MVFTNRSKTVSAGGSDQQFVIRLDVTKPIPLHDLGDFLEDLSRIFKIAAEEYFKDHEQDPSLIPELYVTKLSGGSVELVTEFFSNGVVQGVLGNIIFAIIVRILTNKKSGSTNDQMAKNEKQATSPASKRAVSITTNMRRIKMKFGIFLQISTRKETFIWREDN